MGLGKEQEKRHKSELLLLFVNGHGHGDVQDGGCLLLHLAKATV